jgi:hypothetical protein
MLRNDAVAIENWLRSHVRPTVAQMPRGYVQVDALGLHTEYAYADGQRIGTIMGLCITRLDALADDHRDYYNSAGALIHTT